MKKLNKILLILILLTIGVINKSKGQNDPVIDSLQQEILGEWVLENSPQNKIEFENDGSLSFYYNNQLKDTSTYEIGVFCEGEQQGNQTYFLKQFPAQGGVTCSYIESINYNNNDKLILMTKNQGKMIVYIRP